jgi:hypothetical protein
LYATYSKLVLSDIELTTAVFKADFAGKKLNIGIPTLIELTKEQNVDYERLIGVKYTPGGYKYHKTTLKYLTEFIAIKYGQKDIKLEEVNYKFC